MIVMRAYNDEIDDTDCDDDDVNDCDDDNNEMRQVNCVNHSVYNNAQMYVFT
jgi:hypothetical protein